MSAYVVVNIEVTDPDRYAEYIKAAPPSIAQYGGRYLARGGTTEILEGQLQPKRFVILEFKTYDDAKAWWASQEYSGPKAIRQSASITDMVVVQGV
jgi:uncharacterized protein (DUF1330 family)